ncbi:hypothetical protein [Hwanghaeella sp.]
MFREATDMTLLLTPFFPARRFENAIKDRIKFRRPVQLDHVAPA